MREHTSHFRVGFGDTDSTGRVYFPVYVRWIDEAFIEMLRLAGVTFKPDGGLRVDDETLGVTFVIGEYSCRIESPSTYDDQILVRVHVEEVRKKVLRVEALISTPAQDLILAKGGITYVCVDMSSGKSAEIPDKILSRIL
ncbi:Putative esterase [archaeon HR01]|nr:Putative esterase [archaeon HR01]